MTLESIEFDVEATPIYSCAYIIITSKKVIWRKHRIAACTVQAPQPVLSMLSLLDTVWAIGTCGTHFAVLQQGWLSSPVQRHLHPTLYWLYSMLSTDYHDKLIQVRFILQSDAGEVSRRGLSLTLVVTKESTNPSPSRANINCLGSTNVHKVSVNVELLIDSTSSVWSSVETHLCFSRTSMVEIAWIRHFMNICKLHHRGKTLCPVSLT